jgi:pyruvate,water dikinase
MTLLGDLFVRLEMPPNSFEIMARDETGRRPSFKPKLRQMVKLRRGIPFLWKHARVAGEVRDFVRRQDAALEDFRGRDWTGVPAAELMTAAGRLRELHGRSQWYIFLVALNSMVRKRILDRMVRRHAPAVDPGDLIRGLAGLKALEPNRRLQELGVLAARLPAAEQAVLATAPVDEIEAVLGRSAAGRRILEGFADFQKEFGFLSANGTDIAGASWAEKPERVWRLVARPRDSHDLSPADEAIRIRRRARGEVRAALHPAQRGFFTRLLRSAVVYLNLRERVSLLLSEDAYEMRRVFLAVGDRLVREAGFGEPEDVFYLYLDELQALVAGDLAAAAAQGLVADRRREMERDEQIHPPDTICGELSASAAPPPDTPDEYLVGIGGSSGVVEGRVRIVRDPLAAPRDLGPGDILVVPFTDVGWTPLFAGISGIVAETGGQLSHTAIVAREYNLPAVVSVPGATRKLADFQPVTLDGQAGRVYLRHLSDMKEQPA